MEKIIIKCFLCSSIFTISSVFHSFAQIQVFIQCQFLWPDKFPSIFTVVQCIRQLVFFSFCIGKALFENIFTLYRYYPGRVLVFCLFGFLFCFPCIVIVCKMLHCLLFGIGSIDKSVIILVWSAIHNVSFLLSAYQILFSLLILSNLTIMCLFVILLQIFFQFLK